LTPEEMYTVKNLPDIFRKRINIQGFIYWDHNIWPQNIDKFNEIMPKFLSDGTVKSTVAKFEGLDNAQEVFIDMFRGKTFGKACLKVSEP
jgi:NADPH-dependent curcumin reductase CurA